MGCNNLVGTVGAIADTIEVPCLGGGTVCSIKTTGRLDDLSMKQEIRETGADAISQIDI